MILVSDASVTVKWAVEEEDYEKAARLLRGEHQLHVARVLRGGVRERAAPVL